MGRAFVVKVMQASKTRLLAPSKRRVTIYYFAETNEVGLWQKQTTSNCWHRRSKSITYWQVLKSYYPRGREMILAQKDSKM